jgi:hypothetical protein
MIWRWKVSNGLRVIEKIVQVPPSLYFQVNVLTVGRNAPNDMALESLKKCETFWYIIFLAIPYGFKSILKKVKNVF